MAGQKKEGRRKKRVEARGKNRRDGRGINIRVKIGGKAKSRSYE